MTSGHLKDSVILMNAAKEIFPDLSGNKQQMETDEDEEKEESGPLDTLTCLKNLFMGNYFFLFLVIFIDVSYLRLIDNFLGFTEVFLCKS